MASTNNTTIVSLAPLNSSELFYGVECCLLRLENSNNNNRNNDSSSSSDSENDNDQSSSDGILKVNKKNLPLISIRGWMHQSQGFKVFTNSASFILDDDKNSKAADESSSNKKKKKSKSSKKQNNNSDPGSSLSAFEASIFPESIRCVEELAETALKIVNNHNTNGSNNLSSSSSAHKKNIIWSNPTSDQETTVINNNNNNNNNISSASSEISSGKVSAATVIFSPIDQEFIFAVRVSTSHKTALNEKDVSDFADHALFALTTDVPLHTIIPTGWLSGSASATGRHQSTSLRTYLSSSSSSSEDNNNNNFKKSKKSSCSRFVNDLKKRIEVCSAWWLQVKREERFLKSSTALAESTAAALGAATDADWIERLHFTLQAKFNLPFSVKVSPLMWTPSPSAMLRQSQRHPMNPRSESEADDDTRYVEDGWLIMHERTVVGSTPLLEPIKRRALHHAIALVGSSVTELVSHIGELCAAPPPNTKNGGGGLGDPSEGIRLARPVIPPVVLFDVDVTSWLNSMAALEHQTATTGADSTLQPFSPTTTSSYFHPTTTKLPGWQDTTANRQFVPPFIAPEQRNRRHRVIVVTSAGGAFAPRGFSCAFFLSSSHVPFVGMPLALARDVARASLSEASSLWDQYTEETSAQQQNNPARNELRKLFDNHQVLLHAVMVTTKNSGDYLIQGGSTAAIRTLLGPPAENSIDRTLDGSRKVNDIIVAAQKEIYTPVDLSKPVPSPLSASSSGFFACCFGGGSNNNNSDDNKENFNNSQLQKKFKNGLFHENVLRKLKEESEILSATTSSRQVLTLKHPFFEKSSANMAANEKELEKHVTRRIIAVISVDPIDENARVALFSVPMKTLTEHQCLHLGRILPL